MSGFDPISEDFLGNPLEYEIGDGQSYDDFTLDGSGTGAGSPQDIDLGFIPSVTTIYALAPWIFLPTITSVTAVYTPLVELAEVDLLFIASRTVVYPLQVEIDLGFIASHTVVYALTVEHREVDVPFIPSHTTVYGIFSLFTDITRVGPGNGGEISALRLNSNGDVWTATLAANISSSGTLLELSADSGLPTDHPFVVTIDDEVLYVVPLGGGLYRVRGRGVSNTTPASHVAGADVTWGDSYDLAVTASFDIAHDFTADIASSGAFTYPGWLICFDSSQAYLGADRYPIHVAELVGVFDAGAGVGGTNRLDASQPAAVGTPEATSDDCPVGIGVPARIATNITAGDVAVCRYTNPEASVLDLGPRSVGLQSWFGMKRVDDADNDVTFTDPAGHIVDGTVDGEWTPPVLGPGIAPDTGLPTAHDVPYTSVTLPGADRYFTNPDIGFSEKGWPICALAVRQGKRRVPFWRSWDWRNFNFVYCGFGTDATYVQMLINRNGLVYDSVPEVELPGPQDIDGPDAVWDDGSYYFGAAWYVALFNAPYLVLGPPFTGEAVPPEISGGENAIPYVTFSGGVATVGEPNVTVHVEGGSGGDINPPGVERFDVQLV